METKKYIPIPKDIEDRGRPDGFVFNQLKQELEELEHTNCGTPDCCGTCDTADKGKDNG
jgi:hypothetical protein